MDIVSSNDPQDNPNSLTRVVRYDGKVYYQKRGLAPKNVPSGKRFCPDCEEVKAIKLFTAKTGRLYVYCQECRNRKGRDSHTLEKGQDRFLRKNHGITKKQYDAMLQAQGGVCACCGKPETAISAKTKKPFALAVDHNHETGQNRSLLCGLCNQLVGRIEHDQRVRQAFAYLGKYDKEWNKF